MRGTTAGVALLLAGLQCLSAAAEDAHADALALRVTVIAPARLSVDVVNLTDTPIQVWQERNSWGAARWRVLVLRGDQVAVAYERQDQVFTRNFPSFDEIVGRAHLTRTLNLREDRWIWTDGKPWDLKAGDRVIAIYDVPVTSEAHQMKVWHGVAAGMAVVP
jgi:hypothetical protein